MGKEEIQMEEKEKIGTTQYLFGHWQDRSVVMVPESVTVIHDMELQGCIPYNTVKKGMCPLPPSFEKYCTGPFKIWSCSHGKPPP